MPRPGERVRWYQNSIPYHGILLGHHADGSPRVRCTEIDMELRVESFDLLTLEDPDNRIGPNWTRLGPEAVIVRATPADAEAFNDLLQRRFASGTSQIALIKEVRRRGNETFVTGGAVRDVLSGVRPRDLDIVTTMPLTQLAVIGRAMCPSWPKLTESILRKGRHTVGEASPGVMVDIAGFKKALIGTSSAVFGSDMMVDVSYRDFSVNAIYFDPVDHIFYDPTGFGLQDVSHRVLRTVCALRYRTEKQNAKLCMRAVRFVVDGFQLEPSTFAAIGDLLTSGVLGAMEELERPAFFRSQILDRVPCEMRAGQFKAACAVFDAFRATGEWERYFADEETELLS